MISRARNPGAFLLPLATLLVCAANHSTPAEEPRHLWAVLICVERYADLKIPVPPNSARHASDLAALLSDPERFSLAKDRMIIVGHSAEEASADRWRGAFEQIAGRADANDTLLVILIATGAPAQNGDFRWLAADADPASWPQTSLLSSELQELVDAAGCRRVVTIVDACFNLAPSDIRAAQGVPEEGWSFAFQIFEGEQRVVLASTDGHAESMEGWQSVSDAFFARLVEGLAGKADRDGGEEDGWISAQEIVQYVREACPAAWSMGRGADTWLARNPDAAQRIAHKLEILKTRHSQGQIDERTHAVGARLLERMPRWDDDRKLRAQFVEYLEGRLTAAELESARRQTLTRRNLPEKEAQAFAAKVLEATKLIEKHHLDPGRSIAALSAGLSALANEFGEGDNESVQSDIRRICERKPTDLPSELARLRLRLGRRDQISAERATDVTLSAMLASLDPYSAYLSPDVFRELSEHAAGKYTGIGALLREDPANGSIVVLAPIRGGPADDAGLRPNDRIVAVNGKSVEELGVQVASDELMGPEGSTVRILLHREGAENFDVTVQRKTVELESVLGVDRQPDGTWNYWIDHGHKIAYIQLTTFAQDTASVLRRLLLQLEEEGMLSLILDLRFNRGGLLESAVEVSDLFLAHGSIVRIKGRGEDQQTFEAYRFGTFDDVRLCVLVNSGSASGSEILAASIQDNRRGVIAGSRSFGKASVQDVIPMSDKQSAIKVTSARFFRPDGKNLERFLGGRLNDDQEWGVVPDEGLAVTLYREQFKGLQQHLIRRQLLEATLDLNEDSQLSRALEYLRSAHRE